MQTYMHLYIWIRAYRRCPNPVIATGLEVMWGSVNPFICDSDHLCPLNDWQYQHTPANAAFHHIQLSVQPPELPFPLAVTCVPSASWPHLLPHVLRLCLTVSVLKLLPAFLPCPINTCLAWLLWILLAWSLNGSLNSGTSYVVSTHTRLQI